MVLIKNTMKKIFGKFEITLQSPILIKKHVVIENQDKTTVEEFGDVALMSTRDGVLKLLSQEKKLMAVRFYKFRSQKGLRDSKEWVDRLEQDLFPEIKRKREENYNQYMEKLKQQLERLKQQLNNTGSIG